MFKLNSDSKIKLIIKRDYILESLFAFFLLLFGLLSGYFGRDIFWFIGFLFFIILLLINKSKYRHELLNSFFFNPYFYTVFILGCASIVLGSGNQYLAYNLKKWLKVFLILFGIIVLDSNTKYDFRSVLKSYFYLLNFFWIANLIIVTIQCSGNGFMIKQEWFNASSLYADHCSGLFGSCGTHKLSLFAVFMLVYNLDFARKISSSYRKKGMYIYIFVTNMWMLYISTLNDNKTLFIIMPFYLLSYYIIQTTNETVVKNLNKLIKLIPSVILLVVATIFILNAVPTLASYIQDYIIEAGMKFVTLGKNGGRGSIERITIAIDALKSKYGWLLGKGLGASATLEANGKYLGYVHFGMSSIGTMITLGGIWFYLSVCLFYTHFFYRFIKLRKKSFARLLLCFFILMGLTMYTPIFDLPVSMLWTCLTFVVIGNQDVVLYE